MKFQVSKLLTNRKLYDKVFWLILLLLAIVSMVTMYSAGSQLAHKAMIRGASHIKPFISHVCFLLIGLFVAFVVQQVPSRFIRALAYLLLVFSIFCLILTDFTPLGVSENGARRWLNLGIRFQPSEFAKISLIVVVADLLSRLEGHPEKEKKILYIIFGLCAITIGLILPYNLSTALLMSGVVFLLMFLARVNWKLLVGIIAFFVLAGLGGYLIVEKAYIQTGQHMSGPLQRAETWVMRIDRMMESQNQESEEIRIHDDNIQEIYAQLAVARGGKTIFGVGPGKSIERDYLPLAYADYIFSIYVEETGIAGAIFLIALYLTLLFRACTASNRFENHAASLMVMGLGLMLTLQAFVSMAVAVGLGPVTGQPLPLISRGGTSIILTCIYFGIMMSVSREQNELKEKREQTLRDSENEEVILTNDVIDIEQDPEGTLD